MTRLAKRGRPPDAPCPCGRGRKFKRCCLRLHRGNPAATPEDLMRSRYSAYSVGNVEYIIATTDPNGPMFRTDTELWRRELEDFASFTRFEKLEIRERGPVRDGRGEVLFYARLSRDGADASFCERSSFIERNGRWLYHSGIPG